MADQDGVPPGRAHGLPAPRHPPHHGQGRFPAARRMMHGIGRPGVDRRAADGVPGQAFPGAEIHFLPARIRLHRKVHAIRQGAGQFDAAQGGAAEQAPETPPRLAGMTARVPIRQPGGQAVRPGGHVQPAVAMAGRDIGHGVADQQ